MVNFIGTAGSDSFDGPAGNNVYTTGSAGDDVFKALANSNDTYVISGAPGTYGGSLTITDVLGRNDVLELTGLVPTWRDLDFFENGTDLVIARAGTFVTVELDGQLQAGITGVDVVEYDGGAQVVVRDLVTLGEFRTAVQGAVDRGPAFRFGGSLDFTALEDTTRSFDLNDLVVDRDGDPIAYTIIGSFANPSASRLDGSILSFVPNPDVNGLSSLFVEARSGTGKAIVLTVNATVEPVNDAPRTTLDVASLLLGRSSVVIDVLANDLDPEGDALTLGRILDAPNVEIVPGTGSVIYNRVDGQPSPDRFTYEVADPSGAAATGQVQVSIQVDPAAPFAVGDTASAKSAKALGALRIDILRNDLSLSDKKGILVLGKKGGLDADSLRVFDAPEHGTVSFAKGRALYTAAPTFDGTDTFSYFVADKSGRVSELATVVVTGPDLTVI